MDKNTKHCKTILNFGEVVSNCGETLTKTQGHWRRHVNSITGAFET